MIVNKQNNNMKYKMKLDNIVVNNVQISIIFKKMRNCVLMNVHNNINILMIIIVYHNVKIHQLIITIIVTHNVNFI